MRRDRLLRELLRERFLFTLTTGETFEGLLDDHDESTITLIDTFVVTSDSRVEVPGGMLLPRVKVAYVQRLPHAAPDSP